MKTRSMRQSQRIAAIALLTPVALILSPLNPAAPFIPFGPYAFLKFELWEIPVYFTLFYFGPKLALGIEMIVYATTQVDLRGSPVSGPVFNLIAVLLTMGGVWLFSGKSFQKGGKYLTYVIPLAMGATARVLGMTVVNYLLDPLPTPIGLSVPKTLIVGLLPPIAAFNFIVALYSIPTAQRLAFALRQRLLPSESTDGERDHAVEKDTVGS